MNKRKIPASLVCSIFIFSILFTSIHAPVSAQAPERNIATRYSYEIPYIYQFGYEDIGNSSCAPSSLAMLLQFYYPNSGIDVPEVYHSGSQGYGYHGPATGYKSVSFQSPDQGLEIVEEEFRKYYYRQIDIDGDGIRDWFSGLRSPGFAAQYLRDIWGGDSYGGNALLQEVVDEIKERPLLLNILWEGKRNTGHYVVLRGYDDKGTPDDYTDDKFYVNDPGPRRGVEGETREFDYEILFGSHHWSDDYTPSGWYKGRIVTFKPTLSEKQREYTVVVDNNNVQLDNINAKDINGNYIWKEWYGPGDWYYPNEDGHSVKWVPNLLVDGVYDVHAIFNDNVIGKDLKYEIYYPDNPNLPVGMKSVKQVNAGWKDEKLGTFYLKKGSYVKINNIPSQSNVDAIRFEYVNPISLDLIFTIDTTGSMWDDIDNVKASASAIVDEVLSDIPDARIAVVDYRDFPVDPYGGIGDYPFNDVLSFSTDKSTIVAAIQGLTLGWGADWRESVYSALNHSIDSTSLGGWRGSDQAAKVIILMGDAPPHDPEPFTDLTLSSVSTAAELADPVIIYPIQIGGTVEKFEELADQTGGKAFTAENAGEIVDAILEAIEEIKTKPIAVANGPYTGFVGESITFDGTGSYDLDGTIVNYEWDLNDDGEFDDATGSTPTKIWDTPYSGIISLRVTDDDGATDIDSTTLTVRAIANQPPVADANGPYTDIVGKPITFNGAGSYDPDGTIVSYEWDLDDDGEFDDATGAQPTITFGEPYSGDIHLQVTDDDGATDIDTTTLTVKIPATVDFDPDTLNLKSKGRWVTIYIEFPEVYEVADIDASTILVNDQAHAEVKPIELGDYDSDNIPDLMVKFDRADVQELLKAGDEVEITVTGNLYDGSLFEGSDIIRVINEG